MTAVDGDPETRIGQCLRHRTFNFETFFFLLLSHRLPTDANWENAPKRSPEACVGPKILRDSLILYFIARSVNWGLAQF
jgi:hypothetical protein